LALRFSLFFHPQLGLDSFGRLPEGLAGSRQFIDPVWTDSDDGFSLGESAASGNFVLLAR
jgi:hypothetical protein